MSELDITSDVCPMTWVKTRLELEELAAGECLEVRVRAGESHHSITTNARNEGHTIERDDTDPADTDIRRVVIRHG